MRLGGRLQAAIEVLDAVFTHHRPVAEALKDWGNSHRFAGSGDRAAIGNIVYDALRLKLSHAYMMDDNSAKALAHSVLFRQWGITPQQLQDQLKGDKFAPESLSDAHLDAFSSKKLSQAPEHIKADIPKWLEISFLAGFGENWVEEAKALNTRPPLDMRVNTLKTTPEKALSALSKFSAKSGLVAKNAMRIDAKNGPARLPNVTAEIPFSKGFYEIQDEGSQLAAQLVGAQKGEQVLDYCAGGGGKTLALSAMMENSGQIHAYDADPRRMAPMIERLRRAGTRNVQLCETPDALENLIETCDRVLVDAPCTGTGTWRRRPDTKWRLSDNSLSNRLQQQTDAINSAAKYVKIGGQLTYVTCSVLPEENDATIQGFLKQHTNFEVTDMKSDWNALVPQIEAPLSPTGQGILCTPLRTKTDGFFITNLRRKG